MPDVFTKAKRSEVMSRIRARGNKDTELALATLLRAHRITGWRRHLEVRIAGGASILASRLASSLAPPKTGARKSQSGAPGGPGRTGHLRPAFRVRPDFVFRKLKLAIFVDGCFWHGCPKHATWPANRAAWWRKKILGNQARDALVTRTLRRDGWRVLRVWEHELTKKNSARLIRRLSAAIRE